MKVLDLLKSLIGFGRQVVAKKEDDAKSRIEFAKSLASEDGPPESADARAAENERLDREGL